jgi:DNA-directed RNA polymerase specialized sigma24 family protein
VAANFDGFCKSEYASVYRAAFAFTGDKDSALDATQEAFSRAFARWARLSREPWAGGWVMTTALNLCRGSWSRGGAIGFKGSESMALEIPELEPGIYRLGQDFFRKRRGSQGVRIQWHYAEFEVLE